MKKIFNILSLLLLLLLFGCNLDFGNDDGADPIEDDVPPNYSIWDSETDTKSYYDGQTDTLLWNEVYDYDSSGQCIFRQKSLPNGTVLDSSVYVWQNGKVLMEAFFNLNDELVWYSHYLYNSDKIIQRTEYNGSNEVQNTRTNTYDSEGRLELTARYYSNDSQHWAYGYVYEGTTDTKTKITKYEGGARTAYIDIEYDSSDRVIKKTGYGDARRNDSFTSHISAPGFRETGGVNTENRNTASLTAPSEPTVPSPDITPTEDAVTYSWMSLWAYSAYGTAYTELNSIYLPTYLSLDVDIENPPIDIEIPDETLEVEIAYSDQTVTIDTVEVPLVDSKTTYYDGIEILTLDFTYDANGYPTSLDTSGASLFIPLTYDFAYDTNNIPEGITVSSGTTTLRRLEYEYADINAINSPEEFADSVHYIYDFDGDDVLQQTFEFTYSALTLRIDVLDPNGTPADTSDDTSNGYFELAYDTDGNIASFASYNASNVLQWKYEYGYDDLMNQISQVKINADDLPEVVNTFDIETMFLELKRYLPF